MVDFHWNASDPWTIVSASDDCGGTGGGGTLQVSMFILIYTNRSFLSYQMAVSLSCNCRLQFHVAICQFF